MGTNCEGASDQPRIKMFAQDLCTGEMRRSLKSSPKRVNVFRIQTHSKTEKELEEKNERK